MNVTRILLADDHRMTRQGLRSLIARQPGMEVVAEATDGREAVRLAADVAPDVVVMDIEMPGLNGIEATRQVVARVPGVKVIALTASADERRTADMLRAGASGYVPKASAFREVVEAVRAVAAGKVYLSPLVAGAVAESCRDGARPAGSSAFDRLSPKQREVLQLIAEGKATKEVAAVLGVSVKTVETHRRQIMEKLDLYSVAELTKYALREGLTSVGA